MAKIAVPVLTVDLFQIVKILGKTTPPFEPNQAVVVIGHYDEVSHVLALNGIQSAWIDGETMVIDTGKHAVVRVQVKE